MPVEMREEDDTAVNTAELTANRLRYLINFYLDARCARASGSPFPCPLETVVEWYAQERAKRAANAAQAKQMLAGHKEYQAARQRTAACGIDAGKSGRGRRQSARGGAGGRGKGLPRRRSPCCLTL